MYRALISFSGKVSMAEGEIRDISDKAIADDLLDAGFIEEVNPAMPKEKPEEKPKAEPKPETKKKTTKKKKSKGGGE